VMILAVLGLAAAAAGCSIAENSDSSDTRTRSTPSFDYSSEPYDESDCERCKMSEEHRSYRGRHGGEEPPGWGSEPGPPRYDD
jgi:hypothetical protein